MSGSLVLFVPITIGSCLVVGLLCALRYEGRAGAFFALLVPLIWAVAIPVVAVGAVADGSFAIGDFLGALALGVGFVLFIAACTEVGYLAGRFVARLMRGRRGACG